MILIILVILDHSLVSVWWYQRLYNTILPPEDEHICLKHVDAWNKLIKFSASSCFILTVLHSTFRQLARYLFFTSLNSLKQITLVNTQNVSVTKIVDSSSIQNAETKYDLRIQFLALVVMIHEVWLNA